MLAEKRTAADLPDGVWEGEYESFPNSARVAVTVEEGRIAAVEVLFHGGSWIGRKAVEVIERRIVEAQSPAVDALSGATNSSVVIMNAAQQALDRAAESPDSDPSDQ
ncbi:MAG: FMN-binding protein [Polyangia bacterium]